MYSRCLNTRNLLSPVFATTFDTSKRHSIGLALDKLGDLQGDGSTIRCNSLVINVCNCFISRMTLSRKENECIQWKGKVSKRNRANIKETHSRHYHTGKTFSSFPRLALHRHTHTTHRCIQPLPGQGVHRIETAYLQRWNQSFPSCQLTRH